MLKRCSDRLARYELKAELSCCDFNGYSTDKRYDLIFIGGTSFPLIIDNYEITVALHKLKTLIKKGGNIIISIEPDKELSSRDSDTDEYESFSDEIIEWKRVRHEDTEVVLKGKSSYNPYRGIVYSYMLYELYENNVFIRTEHEDFYWKVYSAAEFEKYVSKCGLIIKNVYRDFEKTLYDGKESDMVIYELTV